LQQSDAERAVWPASLQALYASADNSSLIAQLNGDARAVAEYGAPALVWLQYDFSGAAAEFSVSLQWFQKTPTRLPEAQWLSFVPASLPLQESGVCEWTVDVMGAERVNPLRVIASGTRHMHAAWHGAFFASDRPAPGPDGSVYPTSRVSVRSLDATLVAPGDRAHLLSFDNAPPNCNGGMHFNLQNNLWNTAFPTFYQEDAQFRFTVRLE
jgi:hypothetical protein